MGLKSGPWLGRRPKLDKFGIQASSKTNSFFSL